MINSIILGISAFSIITIVMFTVLTINKKGIKIVNNSNIKTSTNNLDKISNCSFEKYYVDHIIFRYEGHLYEYEDCIVEIHNNYIMITTYSNSIPNNEIFNVSEYKMIGAIRIGAVRI